MQKREFLILLILASCVMLGYGAGETALSDGASVASYLVGTIAMLAATMVAAHYAQKLAKLHKQRKEWEDVCQSED